MLRPKFYSELKQLNEDLLKYLRECQEKSPYFDFTPTLEDYIKQMKALIAEYPENGDNGSLEPISEPPATQATLSFGTSVFPSTTFSSTTFSTNTTSAPATFLFGSLPTTTPATTSTAPTISSFSFVMPKPAEPKKEETSSNQINSTNNLTANEADDDEQAENQSKPNFDKYQEPDGKYSVKCKLYEKSKSSGEVEMNLIGIGMLFVKELDSPKKLQVIIRQEPDLYRILLNEVLTPDIPVRPLPNAVQIVFPGSNGQPRMYAVKVKDETEAKNLFECLSSIKS